MSATHILTVPILQYEKETSYSHSKMFLFSTYSRCNLHIFHLYATSPMVLVRLQIKDTFQKTMRIPTGIVLYAVNPNSWCNEYKQSKGAGFVGSGNIKPENQDLLALKRRNRELEEEVAILKKEKFQISMSRKGNCHDNAVIEFFHSVLKKEWAYP